jgi:hypothetical protein
MSTGIFNTLILGAKISQVFDIFLALKFLLGTKNEKFDRFLDTKNEKSGRFLGTKNSKTTFHNIFEPVNQANNSAS